MKSSTDQYPDSVPLVFLIFSLVLLVLMPSNESIWIDEGVLIQIVNKHSLSDMLHALLGESGSEAQMPLAAFYFWLWSKIAGFSEIALRIGNLIPLAFGLIALSLSAKKAGFKLPAILVAAAPVTWFYANEIRPYSLQLAGACGLTGVMLLVITKKNMGWRGALLFGFSAFLVTASSMLGVFCLLGVCTVLLFFIIRRQIQLNKQAVLMLSFWLVCQMALGAYYLYSLSSGSGGFRGRDVGFFNVAFTLYDSLGFYGLGPDRLSIRDASRAGIQGLLSLFMGYLPLLLSFAAVWLGILCVGTIFLFGKKKESQTSLPVVVSLLSVCGIGFIGFYGAAWSIGFPFWGRHLIWLTPFLFTSAALILESAFRGRSFVIRSTLPALLLVFLLLSSGRQRLLPEYQKDNYRAASAMALNAISAQKKVWWAAGPHPAQYYGLTLDKIVIPDPVFEPKEGNPDMIIISKPDIYDRNGHILAYAMKNNFKLIASPQAFRIFISTDSETK